MAVGPLPRLSIFAQSARELTRIAAAALIAIALSACVQTNVTRAPLEEGETARRAPAAAATATPVPPPTAATPVPEPAPTPAEEVTLGGPAETVSTPPPFDLRAERAGEPIRLQAASCRAEGRHIRVPIARPASLDPSYRGAADGIEVRRTIASGTAGVRHARLSGGFLEADLWVRGSGVSVGALGAESCRGGEPADATFEVFAHYR